MDDCIMPLWNVVSKPGRIGRLFVLVPLALLIGLFGPLCTAYQNGAHYDGTRAPDVPEGYVTLEDLAMDLPTYISKVSGHYEVVRSISMPASEPLFIGPGETVLFDEDCYLNLSGPPIFDGEKGAKVVLAPSVQGENWGGVSIMETDLSTPTVLDNILVESAVIGIRTSSSDLRMTECEVNNCSRSGIEVLEPGEGPVDVRISSTSVFNCTFYGLHLSSVSKVALGQVTILDCGTGMRAYRSTVSSTGLFVLDSGSTGLSLVSSTFGSLDSRFVTGPGPGGSTSQQVTLVGSKATLTGGSVMRANVCMLALSGSELILDGVEVGPSFTDGIQMNASKLSLLDTSIKSCGESAVHSESSSFTIEGSELSDNGAGSGGFVFSTIFCRSSTGIVEDTVFEASGDAHVHSVSSRVSLGNCTLDRSVRDLLILEAGSKIDLINVPLPSNTRYRDQLSYARSLFTLRTQARNYTTLKGIQNAQVDLLDSKDALITSRSTGADGWTPGILLLSHVNSSKGSEAILPYGIVVSAERYEVQRAELLVPALEIAVDMYPPNAPPTLFLKNPLNDTTVLQNVLIEGAIDDDLDVHKLKVGIDESPLKLVEVPSVGTDGSFSISVPFENISVGTHLLWIFAYDGVHLSTGSSRRIIFKGAGQNDTDSDGITDALEDRNGNGEVDAWETDPRNPDTDGDGLLDGVEIDASDGNTTDPLDPDSDGDFLKDGFEDQNQNGRVDLGETDPLDPDTDGDTVLDKDDRYPLDPTRSTREDERGPDPTILLVLFLVAFLLVILVVYVLYIKVSGSRNRSTERERTFPSRRGPPGKPAETRTYGRQRRPAGRGPNRGRGSH